MRRCITFLVLIVWIVFQLGCNAPRSAANHNQSNGGSGAANAQANKNPTPAHAVTPPDLRPSGPPDTSFKSCNPYYPLVPGSQAKYTVKKPTGPPASVSLIVDSAVENGKKVFKEVTQKVEGEASMAKVETTTRKYICNADRIELLSSIIDNKIGLTATGRMESTFPSTATIMIAPSSLKPGASWSYLMRVNITMSGKPEVTRQTVFLNFKVEESENITVPAGTFKALRVAAKVNGKQVDEYYAPGIGLVKRIVPGGGAWELTQYTGLTPSQMKKRL
ncbi:MAG: hypothetical protein J2P52_02645 [Blastocatellia bacterium]|nr:hypothetical protein [Blastocatellia bacterium]